MESNREKEGAAIAELQHLAQLAKQMGNDDGESRGIEASIVAVQSGKMSITEALEQTRALIQAESR